MSTDPTVRTDGKLSVYEAVLNRSREVCTIEESAEISELRELCREGNPFPLIAHQWPELVIESDNPDAKYFRGACGDYLDPCLRLDDWQRDDICRPFFDDAVYEIPVKGNTKPGKGMSVALCVNLWFDCFNPCKIILTSSDHRHARRNIFGEVVRWRKRMTDPARARILTAEIADDEEHYCVVSNPKSEEGFSGQHGPSTLFVFDEATSVIKARYEDACKQARKIVMLGNPRVLSGWFFDMWRPCGFEKDKTQTVNGTNGKRHCVTVGGLDCMNVKHQRLEKPFAPVGGIEVRGTQYAEGERIPISDWRHVKPLIPNQCDYGRYRSICAHPDPRHVAVFGNGKFPDEDPEKQVILQSHLPRHVAQHRERRGVIAVDCFGFDAGASKTGDPSVLAAGSAEGCAGLNKWQHDNVLEHAKQIVSIARAQYGIDLTLGRVPVVSDRIGWGKGTCDKLAELGVWVIEFDAGSRATKEPEYLNLRAQAYAVLGRRLNPFDSWKDAEPWALPDDGELHEDLCAPEKTHIGNDALRFKLQPKEEVAAKLGRSPDKGDAVVMLYHGVSELGDWRPRDEMIASGEDPEEERRPFTKEEMADLPEEIREVLDGLTDEYDDDVDEREWDKMWE